MAGKHKQLAKTLRNNPTEAERNLWRYLRDRQMVGLKFRRQHPIGDYIVDFVCLENKLVVELDGGQHSLNTEDIKRDDWLEREGYRVLRFWNNDVTDNIEGVIETITANCESPSP